MKFKIPGAVWSGLIILVTYLLTANFENAEWYTSALAAALFLAKFVDESGKTEAEVKTIITEAAKDNTPSTRSVGPAASPMPRSAAPVAVVEERGFWNRVSLG